MDILKFFGTWCNPCKALTKVMEETNIKCTPVDVDESEDLVEKYNVTSIPTLIILDKDGNELGRIIGPKTKEQLLDELKKYEEYRVD